VWDGLRVGCGMGIDFSICNSDSDKRAYICVDQRKIKKVIVIIDEWWEKLELVNSCIGNRGEGTEDNSSGWESCVN
jgi:hypothetical protein